jgi:23S rRNA (uracil1939-C5)-methyltransferase
MTDFTENKRIELEVKDLAFDGKAVAYDDGKVVFLKGGLPGEIVLAEITKVKSRYEQGIVREILKKSDLRVPAPCSHFENCGGCTWQDLAYDQQLVFKRKQVVDCLEHIGGLENVEVSPVVGCDEPFWYRNKMEFSFHVDSNGGFTLGLHERGYFDRIFDLDKCYLQSEESNRIVHFIREFITREQIPVYDVKFHHGFMRFVVIRQTKRTNQLMVNLVTNYGSFPDVTKLVNELCRAVPEITTIVHNQNGQKSNIATGEKETVLFGPGYIEEQVHDCTFRIHPNSFFQTNSLQAAKLYKTAFDILEPNPTDSLLDLYCGTGAIGLLLARKVQRIVGVELVSSAIIGARDNAAINGLSNVEFIEGDVTAYLKALVETQDKYQIIVIDPPRAGLHPKALKRIIEYRPSKLLYISCNPATFARDAKDLVSAGYQLPRVIPVDMFPHTMHIELVGLMTAG